MKATHNFTQGTKMTEERFNLMLTQKEQLLNDIQNCNDADSLQAKKERLNKMNERIAGYNSVSFKVGTEIYSTNQTLIGEIEKVNNKTIDVRCDTWQTPNSIGTDILVRFHKAYLFIGANEEIEMYQKSPQDAEIWGKVL